MAEFQTYVLEVPDLTDVISVSVRGTVDYGNAARLRRILLAEVTKTWASRVVIELGGIERIDTAGTAVLVEAIAHGRRRDRQVLLCAPSASVVQVFRLSGLSEALEACCSSPEATRERLLA